MSAMTTLTASFPGSFPRTSTPMARSLYRLSIDKYEAMVQSGVFTKRDRVELIEGYLLAKMAQDPPHSVAAELCRYRLDRMLPAGWHLRDERPIRIPARASLPEPDLLVARGVIRDFSARHPEPADVCLVIEVAESSLDDDRDLLARVYGGGGVTVYWIVNLVEGQVEVYSGPSGPSEPIGYRHCEVYTRGQDVPLVLDGVEVGRIPVADLLP